MCWEHRGRGPPRPCSAGSRSASTVERCGKCARVTCSTRCAGWSILDVGHAVGPAARRRRSTGRVGDGGVGRPRPGPGTCSACRRTGPGPDAVRPTRRPACARSWDRIHGHLLAGGIDGGNADRRRCNEPGDLRGPGGRRRPARAPTNCCSETASSHSRKGGAASYPPRPRHGEELPRRCRGGVRRRSSCQGLDAGPGRCSASKGVQENPRPVAAWSAESSAERLPRLLGTRPRVRTSLPTVRPRWTGRSDLGWSSRMVLRWNLNGTVEQQLSPTAPPSQSLGVGERSRRTARCSCTSSRTGARRRRRTRPWRTTVGHGVVVAVPGRSRRPRRRRRSGRPRTRSTGWPAEAPRDGPSTSRGSSARSTRPGERQGGDGGHG